MWLTVLAITLLGVSIFSLVLNGAAPAHRIPTSSRSLTNERAFDRRSVWLPEIGFISIAFAALVGAIIVLQLLDERIVA